jgi:hypothetical protein
MASNWAEIAHKTLDEERQPITADATSIAKYGAPTVALITALGAGLFGGLLDLSPKDNPEVVVAGAIVIAAAVLGVFLAFAIDIWTRGAVMIARYQAITRLVHDDEETELAGLRKENARLDTHLEAMERERAALQSRGLQQLFPEADAVVLVEPDGDVHLKR